MQISLNADGIYQNKHRGKCTAVGMLTTCVLGAVYLFISHDLLNPVIIGKCVALGLFLQALIYLLEKQFDSFPAAMLATFILPFALGVLPASAVIFAIVVAATLTLFVLQVRALPKAKLSPWALFITLIAPVLYAAMILESTSTIDPFWDEKVQQLALNPDSLFHATMSTMFKNYGIVSTGMNGLPLVHYHFFSHMLYGMISKLLGIEAYQTYGYANLISFGPIFISSLLRLFSRAADRSRSSYFLAHILALGGPLSMFFGHQYDGHWYSESFLIGLILLTGIFYVLVEFQRRPVVQSCALLVALMPFTTAGKISTGAIGVMTCILFVALDRRQGLLRRAGWIVALIAMFSVGYWIARIAPIPGLEVKWYFDWLHEKLMSQYTFFEFILSCFAFFFLLLPVMFFTKHRNVGPLTLWSLALICSSIVGFLALNLTIDSAGIFFSAIHGFVAVVLCASFFSAVSSDASANLYFPKFMKYFSYALQVIFIGSAIFFYVKIVPENLKSMLAVRENVEKHKSLYVNLYADKFKEIANDPDMKLMVYIPKTEVWFWDNFDDDYTPSARFQCIRVPFYIPLLTGKPSILGLPDPKKKCYTFHRGYEVYSAEEYSESAQPNVDDTALCKLVKAKKFHGFYRVGKDHPNAKIVCS